MHYACSSNLLQHFNLLVFEYDASICIAIKTSNRKTSGKAASTRVSIAKERNVTSGCCVLVYVIIKVENVDSCTQKKVSVHSQQLENEWGNVLIGINKRGVTKNVKKDVPHFSELPCQHGHQYHHNPCRNKFCFSECQCLYK
jgi:hypothetical protein